MESAAATAGRARGGRSWLAALLPLAVLGAAIAIFVALDAPGLDRTGPPLEEVTAGTVELHPGEIEVGVRNEGPDPVSIVQATVNDGFTSFSQTDAELGRLDSGTVTIEYPWIEGEAYEIALLTSTGGTIAASVEVAAETPDADTGFYGLMGLIGLYVGIIPVGIGMLWLPWLRSIDPRTLRFLMALTVGLLVFLGIDAVLEGLDFAGEGVQAFGGGALVYLGAVAAYLALAGVDSAVRRRADDGGGKAGVAGGGMQLAFLVALGIGLHNLGEGLAIGSAYAIGALGLGAALIVGFAIHNTTEGLAIVAPVSGRPPSLPRLLGLGLLAGAPVILGAWIGASAFDTSLAAFMLGLGAGAIARVVVQLLPAIRSEDGRALDGLTAAGLLAGLAVMYATGLLITV